MFGKKERTENKKSGNGIVWKLLGCLIIAAALFAVLLNVESNVLSDYEKKMTVICKEQIPVGTRITETNAEQYFETYEIDVKIVSENAVIDKSELIGTVAARTMDARELVKNDDFTKESGIYAKYQEPVEASFKAEHPGDVVSGSIRSGDFVDIAVVDKDTLEYALSLENVFVLNAYTSTGEVVTRDSINTAATMFTIVEEKAALDELYSALEKGNVIVSKVSIEK